MAVGEYSNVVLYLRLIISPLWFGSSGASRILSQKSWSSLRSSSSRPASRRLAMRSASATSFLHVPIDEVLFLSRRIRSRDKGMAALVTSEGGVAKFWDLFSYKKPVGE